MSMLGLSTGKMLSVGKLLNWPFGELLEKEAYGDKE